MTSNSWKLTEKQWEAALSTPEQWVIVSPNGHLCVGTPLYPRVEVELAKDMRLTLQVEDPEPTAIVIDAGPESGSPVVFSWSAIKHQIQILGTL